MYIYYMCCCKCLDVYSYIIILYCLCCLHVSIVHTHECGHCTYHGTNVLYAIISKQVYVLQCMVWKIKVRKYLFDKLY